MKLTITVNLKNAAFKDNEGTEAARILHYLVFHIDGFRSLKKFSKHLRDINGNSVGKAIVK